MFIQSNQTNKGVNTQYLFFSLLKISSISTYFFIIILSIMQTVYFANCDISDIFLLCPIQRRGYFQWMILIDDFIFFSSFHFHNLCILIDEKENGMEWNWIGEPMTNDDDFSCIWNRIPYESTFFFLIE